MAQEFGTLARSKALLKQYMALPLLLESRSIVAALLAKSDSHGVGYGGDFGGFVDPRTGTTLADAPGYFPMADPLEDTKLLQRAVTDFMRANESIE